MHADITVVIPAYNAARYLNATINSVLSQSLRPAEIIVVDDCSTDQTASCAASFGSQVKLLRSRQNSGTCGRPRNIGIEQAQTRLIQVFDSDDLMYPRMLERLNAASRTCPQASAFFCQIEKFTTHGKAPPYTMKTMHFRKLMEMQSENIYLLKQSKMLEALMHEYCLATGALLFTKNAWRRVGGYTESLNSAEDLDFGFKLAQTEDFAFVDEVLYGYRVHPSSKSAQRIQHYLINIERLWFHLNRSKVSPSARIAARRRIAEFEVDLAWAYSHLLKTQDAVHHWWKAIRAAGMTSRMRSHSRKLARHLMALSYKRLAKPAA